MTTHAATAPVAPDDRVSDVLARDEALVEVFVRHASHFTKLRNRAMRRVMARLVTVDQAARIAGIPTGRLVDELNEALGIEPTSAAVPGAAVECFDVEGELRHPLHAPEVEVDVRNDLRRGREPFSRIMQAVAELDDGAVLHLRAIFEPAPLYTVLAKRGFAHEAVRHADDDWSVWFWRPAAAPSPTVSASASVDDAAFLPAPNELWLDVRGLEPPEPLIRTITALETLPEGYELVQVNVRVPQFLIPMLGERGFVCEIDESHADRVLVRIHRPR